MSRSTRVRLPDAAATVLPTPRLQASWRRSEDLGVPVESVEPTFTGAYDTGSLLNECGTEVLRGLQASLANEPISLMIADRDGLVLSRLCNDRIILKSLDKVHLAPGFYYAERNAGTNGLGLSLADRAPSLVRADEHYCIALRGYTCAAAPVLDPRDGELVGTINLTTWSQSSSELLLALAQSAAGNTSALMAIRSIGRSVRPAPRGEVFHVWASRSDAGQDPSRSRLWGQARYRAEQAIRAGQVVAAVGEPGSGRTTLLGMAHRAVAHRERVLTARVPAAAEQVGGWLELWTPELSRPDTCVVVTGVDTLPAWAAEELAGRLLASRRPHGPQPFAVTAAGYDAIPPPLAGLIEAIVETPPLRERVEDIMPLAERFAAEERRRPVTFSATAARALRQYPWPENARQLRSVVRAAAARTDAVDVQHLDREVFSAGSNTHLTRVEAFERDELVRCLTTPGATVASAAGELGISRATAYRKLSQYGIRLPGRRD